MNGITVSIVSARNRWKLLLPLLLAALTGCGHYQYAARPLETEQMVELFVSRTLADPGLHEQLMRYGYPVTQWPMPVWDLDALTLAAWYFHPELRVAIARYHQASTRAALVKQRINPGIEVPLEYHSDTEDGKSPWTIGLLFNFILERPAKREARQAQADANMAISAVNINAVAWDVYAAVRRNYLDYAAAHRAEELLLTQLTMTEAALQLLQRRFELGQVSEFEVNTMRLDLQRIRLTLTHHKVNVVNAWQALAGSLGVPVSALDQYELKIDSAGAFAVDENLTLAQLQTIALTQRLDIQQALADYAAHEATLRLEIEKQFPDLVLSPGFIFDQHDNIWALGTAWILPLFQPQNEPAIKDALALREIKQAEFMAMQARVINDIEAAYNRLQAHRNALLEARNLLAEVEERVQQMQRQYDLGYADHLQLSRSELEAATVQQAVSELEFSVVKSSGQLEDTLHYPLFNQQAYQYLFNPDKPQE